MLPERVTGAERRSGVLQNPQSPLWSGARDAPRNIRLLERRHGLAEIVERGARVQER